MRLDLIFISMSGLGLSGCSQPASLDSGGNGEADCAVRSQWAGGGATQCISWFQNHSGRVIRHLGGGEAFGWGYGQSKRYFESVGQAERMPTVRWCPLPKIGGGG